ncbi:T-cell-specific guanine nucleotide triphosphate-binding protein 2-like [Mytilus edulis]|uniref:T-cell-specific guanine nucleotide triphosphate-binding protein 2-like n=1 Tax=Mytilus edulis TaxID=6550 RepID=UPI0039EF729E
MGQNQSSFLSDNPEILKIHELAKSEGPAAVQKYLDKTLNKWKTESVKFGIIGMTSVGKSTFINSIRNLKEGDIGFAQVGRGNTTKGPTIYYHPDNNKILFADLPGVGTTQFPKASYIEDMSTSECDYFFVFFGTALQEDDMWIVNQLQKLKKPFSLVRSKIDKDVKDGLKRNETQDEVLTRLREEIKSEMDKQKELQDDVDIFFISGKKRSIGEMDKLDKHIKKSLSSINVDKCQAVVYSFGSMSKIMIEEKYKSLRKRVVAVTAWTSMIAAIPVPGLDIVINIEILLNEIKHYVKVFGLDEKELASLKDFDYGQLKCKGVLSTKITKTDMFSIFSQQYGKLVTTVGLVVLTSAGDILMPILGSFLSSVANAELVYRFLNSVLDNFRHDAIIVYEHIHRKIE